MRRDLKHQVFVEFARGLARLSTCKRLAVGCIITDLKHVHAIGYNGQPAGIPHDRCGDREGACGCVHAEANAIAKLSSTVPNLWLHSTVSPCRICAGLIINRGNIKVVSYDIDYRDRSGINLLKEAGIRVGMFERCEDH